MKRCIDCKFAHWSPVLQAEPDLVHELARCLHESSADGTSPVTGRMVPLSCSEARDGHTMNGHCGPEAQFFDPHGREPGV